MNPTTEDNIDSDRAFLGAHVDSSDLLVVILDPAGRIIGFNRACENATGYAKDEIKGKKLWECLLNGEEAESAKRLFEDLDQNRFPEQIENEWANEAGAPRRIIWSNKVVTSEEGAPLYVIGFGIDITERLIREESLQGKRDVLRESLRSAVAEQALSESEERFRAIFETAVEAIITISERGIVESMNPAAESLFGYRADEVIGRNVNALMPSPYRENHDDYLKQYLRTGEAKIIGIGREAMAERKDGTLFPIRLAVSEVRLPDRILFTGFVQDLTEQKILELEAEQWREELERRVKDRTAELVRINEELEHFTYVISHDMRTPLRGIRNYVDFLSEDLADQIEGESAEDLQRLGRAADELERMIEEILSFSKIGRSDIENEEIDVRALIQSIALVSSAQPGKEVVIEGELPTIFAPHPTVRQIFQNLIENGLRYNQSSPCRVEISARPVDGALARWRFAVRDNGIGIDPRFQHKIFGMFQRLQSDRDYPGTGIGLAAVRKAAQSLGGSVGVQSKLGEGSVFYVEIPERNDQKRAGS